MAMAAAAAAARGRGWEWRGRREAAADRKVWKKERSEGAAKFRHEELGREK